MIILLLPLAWIYDAITRLRNWLFDVCILPSREYTTSTICIGNLTVGGTGKTPHTEWLVRHFLEQRKHIAVLSRGYGRKSKGFRWVTLESDALETGDEPLQIRRKFKSNNIVCAVSEDRCRGIEKILSKYPKTEVILLDDAFQHRYVKAHYYILLTDFQQLYTHDYVLPAGRLRENKKGAQRAQTIIVTKCPSELSQKQRQQISASLNLQPEQNLFFTTISYGEILIEKEALLITGIAKPLPLLNYLSEIGVQAEHLHFPDHHNFSLKDKQLILERAQYHRSILTTEKDAMRLESLNLPQDFVARIQIVSITPKFLFGETGHFIKTLQNYVR